MLSRMVRMTADPIKPLMTNGPMNLGDSFWLKAKQAALGGNWGRGSITTGWWFARTQGPHWSFTPPDSV